MIAHLWSTFVHLVKAPFLAPEMVWGIVPLYFSWMMNELTSSKASFRTAIQTGFAFLWAGAHWVYQYIHHRSTTDGSGFTPSVPPVNMCVTALVLVIGLVALISGIRHKFPRYCRFLGHSRFGAYFTIAMFPMQSQHLPWTWERALAIAVFAIPVWLVVHVGSTPLRRS